MIYRMIKIKKVENKIWRIFDFVKIMIDDVLFCVFFFGMDYGKKNYYIINDQ